MTRPLTSLTVETALRLRRALTCEGDELFQLILDPEPQILAALLKNRALTESHLLALLKRRDLPEDLLKTVAQLEISHQSHSIKVALAKNPGTPGPVVLSILPHLRIFELLDICLLVGPSPDQKLAAERAIIQRLPTTPLGNKITLARRGTPTILSEILKGNEPEVFDRCLDNPKLQEIAIIQYLNGSHVKPESIARISGHPRWKTRSNIRLALLKNAQTPCSWYLQLMVGIPLHELKNLMLSPRLSKDQKRLVANELRRRSISPAKH